MEPVEKKKKKKAQKRVRAHVNVFSPPEIPPPAHPGLVEWAQLFPAWKEGARVTICDVGCGFGGLLEGEAANKKKKQEKKRPCSKQKKKKDFLLFCPIVSFLDWRFGILLWKVCRSGLQNFARRARVTEILVLRR
jgi:hypothetical protein